MAEATVEPTWLVVLKEQCAASSQAKVASRIGYSSTVVSQVLNDKYPGDLKTFQAKVEGVLMGMTVVCPVVGDLPRNRCLDYQQQPFAATNHLRVQFSRMCPTCKNCRRKVA